MRFLRSPWLAWAVVVAVLIAGAVVLWGMRSDQTRVREDLADVEQRLAALEGRVEEMDTQASRLDQDVDQLSDGVQRCVSSIERRVRENNRLAKDIKQTNFTSLSQLDPFVNRAESLRQGTQRDLKTCRRAIG